MKHAAEMFDEIMEQARAFAAKAHGDQKYGDEPYVVHLEAVFNVVAEYTDDTIQCQAAWLHDVLEDTQTTYNDLVAAFGMGYGNGVAEIVSACTGRGNTRKERNKSIYDQIEKCPRAVLVKYADRIANVENAAKYRPDLFKMYKKESFDFQVALDKYVPFAMRERLEKAFGYL